MDELDRFVGPALHKGDVTEFRDCRGVVRYAVLHLPECRGGPVQPPRGAVSLPAEQIEKAQLRPGIYVVGIQLQGVVERLLGGQEVGLFATVVEPSPVRAASHERHVGRDAARRVASHRRPHVPVQRPRFGA